MTEKERNSDRMLEEILNEVRRQRQSTETSSAQDEPVGKAKEPADKSSAEQPPANEVPKTQRPSVEYIAYKPAGETSEEEKEEPSTDELQKKEVEHIWPQAKLPDMSGRPLADEDLIDDQFRQFFTTTVAVDRSEMKRQAARNRDGEKKKGLFARLFSKDEEDEDEDEDDYAEFEDDVYAEDEEDDATQAPHIPKDIFAQEESQPDPAVKESPGMPRPSRQIKEQQVNQPMPTVAASSDLSRPVADEAQPAEVPPTAPAPAPVTPSIPLTPAEPVPAPVIPHAPPPSAPPQIPSEPTAPTAQPEILSPSIQAEEAAVPAMVRGAVSLAEVEALMESQRETAPVQPEDFSPIGTAQHAAEPSKETDEPTQEHEIPRSAFVFEEEADELLPDEEEEDDAAIEEYDSPEDAAEVEESLKNLRSGLTLRFILTGLLAVFLLYITLAKTYTALALPSLMSPVDQPMVYLVVCTLLTILCAAVNWPTVAGGVTSVVGQPNPDIAPAFAVVFALLQSVFMIFNADKFAAGDYTPFCGLAALALTVNVLGKSMTCRIVQDNFTMTSAGFDHAAAYLVPDAKLTRKVTAGLGEEEPCLLASRPTALVKGFLRQSFSEHPTDRMAKRFGIAAVVVSVLCGVAVFVMEKDILAAVTCMAGAACLATPLAGTLVGAVPTGLMQSAAARVGAIIPGPSAVEELCHANVVLLDGKDLYPGSSVVLRGIRTFQKERIDLAILYASSILVEGCDTMRDIFLGVVGGKREMLYKVENLTCETGRGFVGWIEGNRIIVGGRAIMQAHDIDIPSMDYEKKYTQTDKRPVYLAVSGRLFGMFLVSYNPSEEVAQTIDELRRSGLSLLVRSNDFCLTSEMIAADYGLSRDSVKVMSDTEEEVLAPHLAYLPSAEGVMTHMGSFASFAGGLHAAQAAYSAERSAGLVQAASVILALLLTLLLSFTAGLAVLSVLAVLLYQLAWLILTLAAPLLKKY